MKNTARKFLIFIFILTAYCTLFPQEIPDTLFCRSILNIDTAHKRNYIDLGDLLFTMPGMWVRNIGATGQWSSCRFWGSQENQVTILLDGHLLIDPWTGYHDLNLIPTEMIDRIETYTDLNPFGLSPVGGVVNLKSKKLHTKRPYTKVVYRSGKNNFSDLDITFGQRFTDRWKIISGVLLKKYGESLPYREYTGQKIRSTITYQPFTDWEINYSILYNKYDIDLPYNIVIPGDTILLTSPHFKSNRYDHGLQVKGNLWVTKTLLQIDHTSSEYEIRERNFNPLNIFPLGITALFLRQSTRIKQITLTWGINTQNHQLKKPDGTRYKNTMTYCFLNGEIPFYRNLISLAQLHFHIPPDKSPTILGSGQLSWKPKPDISLFIDYSEGIRDPSLGERFGFHFLPTPPATYDQLHTLNLSNKILPNLNLKPEKSQTLKTGIKLSLKDKLHIKFNAYSRSIHDLIKIAYIKDNPLFLNKGKILIQGLETQLCSGSWHGLSSTVIINFVNATDEDKKNLFERPNMWGNANIFWEHSFFNDDLGLQIYFGSRYWTESWSIFSSTMETASTVYLDPAILMDFKASFTFMKQAVFAFAVDNIINSQVNMIAGFPLPGTTVRISFSWELYD